MIWAALIFIGIPMSLIAVTLIMLVRLRTKVRHVPGSVRCKVRSSKAAIPGVSRQFPRAAASAHWVHDVLILHAGTFLIRTVPIGVVSASGPSPAEPNSRIKRIVEPVTICVTTDSGPQIELVCASRDADRLLGPFRP